MAPLAADAARPVDERAVEDESAAAAGAEDDAEHRARAGARAVDGLRQGKAVGIVGEPHGPARDAPRGRAANGRPLSQVELAFCTQPACRRQRARHADADAARAAPRSARACAPSRPWPATWRRSRGAARACGARPARCRPGPAPRLRSWCRRGRCPRRSAAGCAGLPSCARRPAAARRARPMVSGAISRLAANTSSSDSSPARCSSTAASSSGVPARARTSAGSRPVARKKALHARRLLGQERKPLHGNGFRRLAVHGWRLAPGSHRRLRLCSARTSVHLKQLVRRF